MRQQSNRAHSSNKCYMCSLRYRHRALKSVDNEAERKRINELNIRKELIEEL